MVGLEAKAAITPWRYIMPKKLTDCASCCQNRERNWVFVRSGGDTTAHIPILLGVIQL